MEKSGWTALGLAAVWGLVVSVSAQTVPKALLAADLEYVVETVSEVHPAFVEAGRRQALADRAAALLRPLPDEVPRWRVGVTVAELLREVDDGHTSTDLAFGSLRYLTLDFEWLSDGLIVAPVTGARMDIPVASRVLKIGEFGTAAVANRLSQLVSENKYWVREIGSGGLAAESVLRWLGVVEDDAVTLTLRTPSGEIRIVKVGLTGYGAGTSLEMERLLLEARGLNGWHAMNDVVAWRVDTSCDCGLFWLRRFEVDPKYYSELQKFFEEVTNSDVGHIVVSVQQNGGGNNSIVQAFLDHLPIESIRGFVVDIRYSPAALQYEGATQAQLDEAIRKNQVGANVTHLLGNVYRVRSARQTVSIKNPVFAGQVHVLTDNASYSSAVDMAVVLSDNGLATVVGEPTGGMPTSFGNYIDFMTPGLSLPFRVSYKYFVRPDPSRDPANTLEPDVPLPVTVKDVQTGYSPVLAWLESLTHPSSAAGQ